jgi:hypothetical protein
MPELTDQQLDDLAFSAEYAEYIMANSGGDRIVCNGDTLLKAMEDQYLFTDFLKSLV